MADLLSATRRSARCHTSVTLGSSPGPSSNPGLAVCILSSRPGSTFSAIACSCVAPATGHARESVLRLLTLTFGHACGGIRYVSTNREDVSCYAPTLGRLALEFRRTPFLVSIHPSRFINCGLHNFQLHPTVTWITGFDRWSFVFVHFELAFKSLHRRRNHSSFLVCFRCTIHPLSEWTSNQTGLPRRRITNSYVLERFPD